MGLIFGIYPGNTSTNQADPPEQAEEIKKAISLLQQGEYLFLVRGYLVYIGFLTIEIEVPENMLQYISDHIKLDLTLCYRS